MEKREDETEAHIQQLEFHIQSIEVELAEFTNKYEILLLELQQVINEKQIAENAVKLAEADKDTKAAFGGAIPAAGAGRSSAMLRKTFSADGRVCIPADIVETLKDAPIRTGASPVLDQELRDTLDTVAEMSRNTLSWSTEGRLSEKGMSTNGISMCI